MARVDDDTDSLIDVGSSTSGASVTCAIDGSRMASVKMEAPGRSATSVAVDCRSTGSITELGCFQFLGVALFEPREYVRHQVVLDPAGIFQRGCAI